MFEPITKVLKKGNGAANEDQKRFNQYSRGIISIDECLSWFFFNNKVRDRDRKAITHDLFNQWLRSLGYGVMK